MIGFSAETSGLNPITTYVRIHANYSRRVSYEYNLTGVLNLHAFVELATRLMTSVGSGRRQ
jgi:hypothetical protein